MARTPTAYPDQLNWKDKYYLVSSLIMLFLGLAILVRVIEGIWNFPILLAGLGFIAFSLYRLKFYWAYFKHKQRKQSLEYRIQDFRR
jgi:membrane protein implicated in regulation of membrane protease activity